MSREYLSREIKRTVKLGLRVSEEPDSEAKQLLETYLQNYLMALIAMRDLKIPYLEHHPITQAATELHQSIQSLQSVLEKNTTQMHSEMRDPIEQGVEEES